MWSQSGCWRQQLLVVLGSVSTSGNLIVAGMKWSDSTISASYVSAETRTIRFSKGKGLLVELQKPFSITNWLRGSDLN